MAPLPPQLRRDAVTSPQEAGQALTSVMRGGRRCPHPCSWPASGALRPCAGGMGPVRWLPQRTCHLRGRCHHRLPCMSGCESCQHGVHGRYGPARHSIRYLHSKTGRKRRQLHSLRRQMGCRGCGDISGQLALYSCPDPRPQCRGDGGCGVNRGV